MDWFLYDNGLLHERVKPLIIFTKRLIFDICHVSEYASEMKCRNHFSLRHSYSSSSTFLSFTFILANINKNPSSFVFRYFSLKIYCTLFMCFAFDGLLLRSIYFQMTCSNRSMIFENMHLLSC